MRWQKQARFGFAIFTVVFGAVVYFSTASRQPPDAVPATARTDPSAVIESTGAIVTQAKGTEEDFKIAADRQLGYADGSSRLEGVTITIAKRAGRSFVVTGREAEVGPNRVSLVVRGDVRLVADDGLTVETDEATFHEEDGLLRVPGRVRFNRARLSGSGFGATYDRERDILWLLDEAAVDIAADSAGQGKTAITATTAAMDRPSGHVRFEGQVRIDRDVQIIEAETADARLTSAQDRIELIELRGNSSVTAREGSPAILESMHARDIDLTYGPDGQVLESALLTGGGAIALSGTGGARRRISADRLDLGLEPDGQTLQRLQGERNVVLEFPATDATPQRRITARDMVGRSGPGVGLTALALTGGVEQVESTGTSGARRRVTARSLDLGVAPGLGDIASAEFNGDVAFDNAGTTGTAPHATYDITAGSISLGPAAEAADSPADGPGLVVPPTAQSRTPPTRPIVRDDRVVIEADTIDLRTAGDGLVAKGDVKTVMQPVRSNPGETSSGDATRPAVLDEQAPVYVAGATLDYDQTTGRATYTGAARLWQGETTIQGDRLSIDDRTGDLTATGSARSLLVLKNRDEATTGLADAGPSLATADSLKYEESERRVTYLGRVVAPAVVAPPVVPGSVLVKETWVLAHVTGPQGDLSARRIEMYLADDGSTVERVEGYDDVKLKTAFRGSAAAPRGTADVAASVPSEARDATGQRLTYFGADARYVMHGAPVTIIEKCRETLGKSLTFFTAVDTITVDGNEEIRTQTTAGSECAEPPSE